ncbi:MAG: aspartate carbamoyltransferase catalytic subunit [Microbacteriaceae bacterium]|nr:aspartate carbamoyltransferase catalytic subunit [Microbacteriaceae bacterium]
MRHLLHTKDLSRDEAIALLDLAGELAHASQRGKHKLPSLKGKTVVSMFFEDSTRTRISFDTAAKRLSADVLSFSGKGSSVSKGESLQDTAQTLNAIGADAVVIRHSSSGAPALLANRGWIDLPVLNAGDGTHEHPTQALLDAYTMRERLHPGAARGKGLDGVRVAIVGDIAHSRVARSNLWLLNTLGAEVTYVAPETLLPYGVRTWPAQIEHSLDRAIDAKPDVLMMLRIQTERMKNAFFPSAREYAREWGLTAERFARLPEKTLIMHPGPMNRGLEIAPAAADAAQATVLEQVANGVSVRMAALHTLLVGPKYMGEVSQPVSGSNVETCAATTNLQSC